MRTWRAVLGSAMAAVLALSLSAAPAVADEVTYGQQGFLDQRPAGLPTSTNPWERLTIGSFRTDWRTGEVTGWATLESELPLLSMVEVRWHLGHLVDGVCSSEVTWATILSGETAGAGPTAIGTATVPGLAHDYTYARVTLTSNAMSTDELRGTPVPVVGISGAHADPVSQPLRTVADKPTNVLLLVRSHLLASQQITVNGAGTGVAMKPVTTTGVAADEVRPVVATVTAQGTERRSMRLQARDERGNADYDSTANVVGRAPKGRLEPGRYRAADGAVRFVVDRRHRVRRLRAAAAECDLGVDRVALRWVLRLPRSGAGAAVRRLASGWVGVSVLTTRPRRAKVQVVVTAGSCVQRVETSVRRVR